MNPIDFVLRTDWIALDALLKATGAAGSGGNAKMMIQGAEVQVDGQPETRRTKKIRAGQVVQVGEQQIQLISATD